MVIKGFVTVVRTNCTLEDEHKWLGVRYVSWQGVSNAGVSLNSLYSSWNK